jgi:hypothetical protein
VPRVHDPLTFLRTFTERLPTYNIHTQGHPPGMVLVLWTLDRVGLGGLGANLALVLAGGAASIAAVMVAVRDVADEATARAVAPFLVLAPAAIWWSSGDAFFAGVSAWAVTLVILATGTEGRRSDRLALAGGVLFGATAMLSYGLVQENARQEVLQEAAIMMGQASARMTSQSGSPGGVLTARKRASGLRASSARTSATPEGMERSIPSPRIPRSKSTKPSSVSP